MKKTTKVRVTKINGGVEKFITFYTISLIYYKNNNYISEIQIKNHYLYNIQMSHFFAIFYMKVIKNNILLRCL